MLTADARSEPEMSGAESMAGGQTVTVTDDTFAGEVEESKGLVLVDFWAAWCGPCRLIAPTLEALAKEYDGRAKVAKLDVDANQKSAMKFNIRSIPAVLFFKDGKHIDSVIGAMPRAAFEQKIQAHLSA
jgi:thioredoxin 1